MCLPVKSTPMMLPEPDPILPLHIIPDNSTSNCNAYFNYTTSTTAEATATAARPIKKRVRFLEVVHVAPFERASPEEARDIWFAPSDISSFKKRGREMAASYRKLGDQCSSFDTTRGFECYTTARQRRRLLSNRCAVYAYQNGIDADTVATLYQHCNHWSSSVAVVQAIHDFADVYTNTSATTAEPLIPSVDTMVPPPELPFAVQCAMILQEQRKESPRRRKRRITGVRRVRQRVC